MDIRKDKSSEIANRLAKEVIACAANSDEHLEMRLVADKKNQKVLISIAGNGLITVDWGDGQRDTRNVSLNAKPWSHDYAKDRKMHTITISGNVVIALECIKTGLVDVDISKNPYLIYFNCTGNHIENIKFGTSKYLSFCMCNENRLTSLDLSGNNKLQELTCRKNHISSLVIGENRDLYALDCGHNYLTSLDISRTPALSYVFCPNNYLTSLNIDNNSELIRLICANNRLTGINIVKNPRLIQLEVGFNRIESIDASNNRDLFDVAFAFNKMNADAINRFFNSLSGATMPFFQKIINMRGNPGTRKCDRSIAEKKGWTVYT
ncbi:MAG: hypothetical protein LBD59_12435 [Prevotellaceae bacterium]|jgi:hypothetical protein|nr:hypothetical protein [Prevotellaceae bacterium]